MVLRRTVRCVAVALLALVGVSSAFAANDDQTNCVAVLTSHFGPLGQVDDAAHFLREAAAAKGMTFGAFASELASKHGDLEYCLQQAQP